MAKLRRISQQSPTMLAAMESYLLAQDAAGLAPVTLHHYRNQLQGIAAVWGNPPLDTITAEQVRGYLVALRQAGRKPTTCSARYRTLTTFFRWAVREGLIAAAPTDRVDAPRLPETQPAGFSEDELRRLVAACNPKTAAGARDRAMILTLFATGLRIGELAQLRKDDVLSTGVEHTIRVRGKGHRERLITIGKLAREAIALYLLRRGEDDEPALWLGERGPLCVSGLKQRVEAVGLKAGVAGCHAHRFRNTALNAMLAAGMDAAQVARIAGHKRLEMLRHYVAFDEQRRANQTLQAIGHVERIDWSGRRRRR